MERSLTACFSGASPRTPTNAPSPTRSADPASRARSSFTKGRGFAFVAFANETSYEKALAFVPPRESARLFAEIRAAAPAPARATPRVVSVGDARRATFAVQCQESHAERLEAYLRSRFGVEVLGVAAPNEPPREGRRLTERVVLCRRRGSDADVSSADAEIIRRVRADPALAMHRAVFPRVYDLRDSAVFASLAAASRAVVDLAASDAAAAGGEEEPRARAVKEKKTRLETFPPSAARSPELAAAVAARPAARSRFTPRRSDATNVATVVSLRGDATIVSYGGPERAAATGRSRESDGEVKTKASRAYLKLAECALRDASLRDALAGGEGVRAVDVGAAPGGWTQFLARKGCRVVAIDPADVPNLPSGCRHLKTTAQSAWESLRHETNGWCPFDVYVSDAVLHDADAQRDLLRGAVENGLLREDAVVVVTFKSAPGRGAGEGYRRAAFARARKLGDELFSANARASRTRASSANAAARTRSRSASWRSLSASSVNHVLSLSFAGWSRKSRAFDAGSGIDASPGVAPAPSLGSSGSPLIAHDCLVRSEPACGRVARSEPGGCPSARFAKSATRRFRVPSQRDDQTSEVRRLWKPAVTFKRTTKVRRRHSGRAGRRDAPQVVAPTARRP